MRGKFDQRQTLRLSTMPLQSKGFAAWISVDDAELDCYNVEAMNDGKKVTCWIASEAGKASLGN